MRTFLVLLSAAAAAACATRTGSGPPVAVYEADAKSSVAERRLPEGCRLLGTAGPIEQMESERAMEDPYRRQRLETSEKGGNVLLAVSDAIVRRPNLDCPSNDRSPDCLGGAQGWFRVSFEEYACSADAIEKLSRSPAPASRGGITVRFPSTKKAAGSPLLSPAEMKQKIVKMMEEGIGPDVIAAWVRGERLGSRLSAEDLVEWKRAGIPDIVLMVATER